MRAVALVLLSLLAACDNSAAPPDSGTGGNDGGTPGPGGGQTPTGPTVSLGGCRVFPADNTWNRNVSGDAVASSSGALLAQTSPGSAIHLDLGTTEEYYGIPWSVVRRQADWPPSRTGRTERTIPTKAIRGRCRSRWMRASKEEVSAIPIPHRETGTSSLSIGGLCAR